MTILDSRGRYIGTQDEPAPRPAGPWSTNADPRAALRGRELRKALEGEYPVRRRTAPITTSEVLAELAMGRRV